MSTDSVPPVFILYDNGYEDQFFLITPAKFEKYRSIIDRLADNPDNVTASFRVADLLCGTEDVLYKKQQQLARLDVNPSAHPKKIKTLKRVIEMLGRRQDMHEQFCEDCIAHGGAAAFDRKGKVGASSQMYFLDSPDVENYERPDLALELDQVD